MQLTLMSDILLRDAADPGHVKRALAHGFNLPLSAVNLRTMGDLDPVANQVSVQLTREPQSLPGEFAAWYHLSLDPVLHSRLDRVLADLARDLQTVVGTDDDGMVLYLPDGSRHQVQVEEDDDGAIEFSNAVQTLIRSHAARTAASS